MICTECEIEFDIHSPEKKRAGGKINQCPACSEETEIKVIGIHSSSGKMAGVEILKFESEEDRQNYMRFYQNNSGLHRGKVGQLGKHLSTSPKIKFKTVNKNHPNENHKGKQ